MEEDPASPAGKRRTLRSVRWLILFIAIATAVAWILKPPSTGEARTLFLHPDGMLSLGSREGERFPPSAIASWPSSEGFHMSEHFVLDASPETPASKWAEPMEQLAILGYGSYQLRSAGESMHFHFPTLSATIYSTRTEPQWVDIRRDGGEKPELHERFDVVVVGDASTTCGEILAATRPHRIPGRSLFVTGEGLGFWRAQDEDRAHQPPKQSLAARVRNLFRP